jgi:predicted GIY-YIG superfamily endonuclease
MCTWTVYALCNPKMGEIRYIGKARNVRERFFQHIRRTDRAIGRWILSLGRAPELVIIGEFENESDALASERRCICRALRIGFDLINANLPSLRDIDVVKRTAERNCSRNTVTFDTCNMLRSNGRL